MKQTLAAIEALGNHLSGIHGRKSLIWIGGGISMLSITGAMGMGPRGGIQSYEKVVGEAAERLAHQGITLYIVDARGLLGPEDSAAFSNMPSRTGRPGVFERQRQASSLSSDPLPAMYKMAGITGGRVITNSNDPTDGMKAVAADLRGTYSIGFYAPDEPDNQWHGMSVKVRRRGVRVLHRKGYLSEAAAATPQHWGMEQWGSAIRNPLGSTAVRMDAGCQLIENSEAAVLSVVLNITARDLHFRKNSDKLSAEIEIALAEKTATGEFSLKRNTATINVSADRADQLTRGLVSHSQVWKVTPGALTFRLMVRDSLTGRYGTLDLPVKNIPRRAAAELR
jgi:hypothetical protein